MQKGSRILSCEAKKLLFLIFKSATFNKKYIFDISEIF